MFLDDEVAATQTRRNEARWGLYLAVAALAACIVMIVGLMAQSTAEAAALEPQRAGRSSSIGVGTGTQLPPAAEARHHG